MIESGQNTLWSPTPQTKLGVDGFVAMHGGPQAMYLPEHEHSGIQIEAHFSPKALSRGVQLATPETYRLIPSGKPHVGCWSQGSEVIVFLLDVQHLEVASDELCRSSRLHFADEIWGADSVIHSIASLLRREFLNSAADQLFLEASRTVLTGHLIRTSCTSSRRSHKDRLPVHLLRRAVEMIEDSLEQGIKIERLAERCGMGTHRFTALFRASTGYSPYRYIMNLRTARAKEYLTSTSMSLSEIAFKLGFASQSHFSTSFRQHTQLTPNDFRRQSK